MNILEKIEAQVNRYKTVNGEDPLSLEVSEIQKDEINFILNESGLIAFTQKYEPVGEEFGVYRGIKVYVERSKNLKIV